MTHSNEKKAHSLKGIEENYDELRYEGFGPNGAMVIVDTLTTEDGIRTRDPNLGKVVFYH